MSEESQSEESIELQQQQQPQPMLMGDEEDHDEDEPDEDDDDEDDDDQGEDDDEDHGMEQLELIEGEDDYDQEDEPDEDQEIMEIGWNAGGPGAHRLNAANPANDIIVFNADAGNQRQHPWGGHNNIVHHYGGLAGYRGRAANANPSADWSQEEIDVQRILGNLGNNRPVENARRPHAIHALERDLGLGHHYGAHRANNPRDEQEQLDAAQLKKGIIESTFEELKVMTDFELSKMVNSQQVSIDKDMITATSIPVEALVPGQNPPANQRYDRERLLHEELRRLRRLVDEVDEDDYNPFRAMAHRFDIGENDFLNHLLNRDALFQPRAEFGDPFGGYRRGAQGAPGQGGDDDQSLFLNSSTQAIQALNQQQHINNSFAEQILTGINVQIEEDLAQPVQSPPVLPSQAQPARRSQAGNNPLLSDPNLFNFLNAPGGLPADPHQDIQFQNLNEMFNQMANILPQIPASVPDQPPQQNPQPVVEQPAEVVPPIQEEVLQQPAAMEDVSGVVVEHIEQPNPSQEQPVVVQQQVTEVQEPMELVEAAVAEEENKQAQVEEEKKQEEQQPAAQEQQNDGYTFGYSNDVLEAFGLEPSVLHELPEEVRIELFASLDLPPPNRPQAAQPSQQQQPGAEEQKNNAAQVQQPGAQQQPAAQAQQPAYAALAQELGLDAEFLANIPEDMRMELIQQRQREIQQPVRQAEQMDLPSFIATVTDRNLRREIFMNMDEATLNTLPPPLMAEGRQIRDYIQNDRARREAQLQERERLEAALGGGGIFGAGYRGGRREREELERQQQRLATSEKSLEEVVNLRQVALAVEGANEDLIASINSQILQDEKIIEVFLLILLANEKIECDLIPTMLSLIKIQNSHGVPVIRNKIVNAITFILKSLSIGDETTLKEFLPKVEFKKKQSVLLMIGCLRLLLKQNKSLMKYILKGLISREESKGTQILRKQLKAMQLKQPMLADGGDQIMTNVETEQIDTKSRSKTTILYAPPAPLAEIFNLIKSDVFKQDRSLMKNLTLLIHQILKQFDIARQELEQSSQQISQETISTIAEVLSLENIDQHMMEDLGDFFFKIAKQKKQNFSLLSDYCLNKSTFLLEKLRQSLSDFISHFEKVKTKVLPDGQSLVLGSRQISNISDQEEEKIPGDLALDRLASIVSSAKGTKQKGPQIKLDQADERELKQHLKIYNDSEVLYRIFKLFNMFYDKFSAEIEPKKDQAMMIQAGSSISEDAVKFVKETYQNEDLKLFIVTLTDVLKIVMKVNFDPNETISNLIFCVLTSFYPELFDAKKHEEEMKEQEIKLKEEKKDTTKYQIKMKPITSSGDQTEKFSLLRHQSYFTNRIEEMSAFCLVNKRIINKMIKAKPALFTNELDGFVRYMPNLLDFENKRSYFKKEIHKMKRSNDMYGGSVQLYIRRDDILHDAFTQVRDKTANELKGRLHISFTGERGQDAGGLTRDFFIELSREMFNPNYSLFILSSSGSTYLPNPKSYVEVDHLRYFKFIGRMLGKALFDECLLECYFVKSFYKIMLGETLTLADIEDFDKDFYDNMKWCLENDVECLMTTFVAITDYFGKQQEVDLIENGRNIQVTNQNKREYVEKLAYFKMYKEIQKQVDNFLEGFYELIPKDLISIFNYKELELLISGLPNFDLEDLKQNTEYHGYNANSPQVLWLWEVLDVLDNSDRAEFLQFVTGSSKVPLDGFKGLIGMRGPQKFTIAKIKTDDIMRLPSGHTCFNQIDLPEYPSKEILHERLMIAIKETKGFGFA